ncbi:signal recognition particle-docking protein FtsY [Leadbettera azotonutricia]|uniref:Signal recognition particle receptor FtsY n=1 Tax=Leadbettera azotonutricia (strain ATCC BAA-888 / DSM 13862 / ZAS-9) TaxID=545695 RepID=F5YG66_LEAAZ|nr:signal recognition particle-docking protein FtsY [Leadbettera azotonutricia]AEF80623.1 signal recognition particle-docking protein FtsY [Leadbettera azotonutricia ZAS-9]
MSVFSDKIKNFFGIGKTLSGEVFEDLTDLLVEGDFGAAGAYRLADELKDACKKEKVADGEGARKILAKLLEAMLLKAKKAVPPEGGGLAIILLLGVNGVGKTTTAAKLADKMRGEGKKPILAAGDTFRAAAIDQLKIHGERLGVRVVAHQHGGDPAAVVYDAVEAAQAGGGDVIIADTAGRMHTKSALVEELKKIDRIVESKAKDARYIKYLVLDATTGRNALAQAEIFHQAVSIDGVILTKFDSSAKGGVVFSLAEDLALPVIFLCTGEKYGDIKPFDSKTYAEEFSGLV